MNPKDEVRIRVEPSPPDEKHGPTGRASSSSRSPIWLVIGLIAVGTVSFCGWLFRRSDPPAQLSGAHDQSGDSAATAQAETVDRSADDADVGGEFTQREFVVADDGKLLWASPTTGAPISLKYIPASTRLLLNLRPAELASHSEGEKVLAALGPWGKQMVDEVQRQAGVLLDQISALMVAIYTDDQGQLRAILRAELLDPWDDAELRRRFKEGEVEEIAGQTVLVGAATSRFLPVAAHGAMLVACPSEAAKDLVDSQGAPPPLPRNLSAALRDTDANRTFTLVVDPRFLKSGGSRALAGRSAALRDALESLHGPDALVATISANWGDRFFLELRVLPTVNTPPVRYARRLSERLELAPDVIEGVVQRFDDGAFGRRLIERLPEMTRQANSMMRFGSDGQQGLVRVELPVVAGQCLLAAAELLISRPGASADGRTINEFTAATADEVLAKLTSLQVRGESLERSLQMLGAQVDCPIEIRGRDLQLDGITRNQTLDLELRDQPAGEILTAILVAANPDRSAAGPADPRQKLVYVVEEPDSGQSTSMRIIVTTRAAAAERDDILPQVFVQPRP